MHPLKQKILPPFIVGLAWELTFLNYKASLWLNITASIFIVLILFLLEEKNQSKITLALAFGIILGYVFLKDIPLIK